MSAIESSLQLITNPENKDVSSLIENLEMQRKKVLEAVLDPTYAGPIFLLYALKGKLGMIERVLLGSIGAATILYAFRNHQMIKAIREQVPGKML